MRILVVSENTNNEIKSATLNSISAASMICEEIDVVVLGNNCENVVNNISKIKKDIARAKTFINIQSKEVESSNA